ncbi:hypothetical protein ElyMa_005443500 [Elysia marginata]|uniref:Uncharacterized protein n=1 Tax=Elysia marginata TaxID=1093978 RepID=A0AAV4ENB2_9GAST|nr:hypothetical protein ElyMa_005443500 [Elysia marginata]
MRLFLSLTVHFWSFPRYKRLLGSKQCHSRTVIRASAEYLNKILEQKKYPFSRLRRHAYRELRPYVQKAIAYHVVMSIGSVGFTADDWLTGLVSPSASLDFLSNGLRLPGRADNA